MSNIWLNDRTGSCYSKTDAAQSAPCHCLLLTTMDKCLLNTRFYEKVTFEACVHDHGFLITQPLSEHSRKQIINPHLLHSLLASHCGAKKRVQAGNWSHDQKTLILQLCCPLLTSWWTLPHHQPLLLTLSLGPLVTWPLTNTHYAVKQWWTISIIYSVTCMSRLLQAGRNRNLTDWGHVMGSLKNAVEVRRGHLQECFE